MESEQSRLVDALPGMVWTALSGGRIDYVNRRWCEYTGLGVDEALGVGWQAVIHPEDLPQLLERWPATVTAPGDMEARIRHVDGTYRWFLLRMSQLEDASGQAPKWCGVTTDIEDRGLRGAYALDYRARWWLSKAAREGHFSSIDDGIPALAALMKPGGGVEHANRHALTYFGSTLEALEDWVSADKVHPEDLPRVLAAWNDSAATAQPYDILARRRRADGAYRWFHMRRFPLLDTEGAVYFWYIFETDVDDLKRAENLLAGEKRLLDLVARGHPMPGILEALCHLIESTVGGCYCSVVLVDATGARLEHGAAPSMPASFMSAIVGRAVNADAGPCAMATYLNEQIVARDIATETRWQEQGWCQLALEHGLRACWSTPIASTAGKVLGAFAICYDTPNAPTSVDQNLIHQFTNIASIAVESAQGQDALLRSKAFLTRAQQLSSTGSFSWRVATGEMTWSEQMYRIFEVDQGVAVTLDLIGSRFHPEDLPLRSEMVARARDDGGALEYEYRLQARDSSVKYVHMVAEASRGANGELEYIGAVQDVTQRRLSEEALGKVRSELAHVARVSSLGALTASIAHEVNQPLSGIVTNASTCLRMLAADPPNIEGALETARRTIRDSERASEVIARLRALFSKQGATVEPVDLNEAAREVIALSMAELQHGGVVLRTEFADDLPRISGDRVQLQQVILNLLMNAIDSMSNIDRSRQLAIKTERDEGSRVRLAIRDVGVGLEPGAMDRLFDAFYTTKSHGMGIGLCVSRSIIESHHGRLWGIPNTGPGATFSFSIPMLPTGHETSEKSSREPVRRT